MPSNIHPLLLACLVFCSVRVVASSKKRKRTASPLLRDTCNDVDAVELEDDIVAMRDSSLECPVLDFGERTSVSIKGLMAARRYEEVAKFGEEMRVEEFLKHIRPVMTTVEHYIGLFEHLKRRAMRVGFLIHVDMSLVRNSVVELMRLGFKNSYQYNYSDLFGAIISSLKGDRHDRAIGLFEAAHGEDEFDEEYARSGFTSQFEICLDEFFVAFPPEKNSMPLKRFIACRGEEFSKRCPFIFEAFCQALLCALKSKLFDADARKLLVDLAGQPLLITSAAFARVLSYTEAYATQAKFFTYGWREAIEVALEGEPRLGRHLWKVLVEKFPCAFSGEYPCTADARAAALRHIKTKQMLEDEWANENVPKLAPRLFKILMELVPDLLPSVLWNIVSGYAITWIVTENDNSPT